MKEDCHSARTRLATSIFLALGLADSSLLITAVTTGGVEEEVGGGESWHGPLSVGGLTCPISSVYRWWERESNEMGVRRLWIGMVVVVSRGSGLNGGACDRSKCACIGRCEGIQICGREW